MKKFLIFYSILLFTVYANSTSLDKAIKKGIEINYKIINSKLDLKISEQDLIKSKKDMLFSTSLSAKYFYNSEKLEMVFPSMTIMPGVSTPEQVNEIGSQHNFDISLNFIQPLYYGNILRNNSKLKIQEKESNELRIQSNINDFILKVKLIYYKYRILVTKRESINTMINELKNHLKRIEYLYKENLINKNTLIETKIKVNEAELSKRDIEKLIENEKINFKKATTFDIEKIEDDYSEKDLKKEIALNEFLKNNPFLKILEKKEKSLSISKRIKAGNYLPFVNLFFSLHYAKPGLNFFENEWSLYFRTGINLNMKVFDWGKLKNERKITDFQMEKIKNIKRDFIKDIKSKFDYLYKQKLILENKLIITKELKLLSEQEVELKKRLFKEKQIDNIEYMNSILKKERYNSMLNELKINLKIINTNINYLANRRKND